MNQLSRVLLVLSFVFFTTSVYAEMVQEGSGEYLGGEENEH